MKHPTHTNGQMLVMRLILKLMNSSLSLRTFIESMMSFLKRAFKYLKAAQREQLITTALDEYFVANSYKLKINSNFIFVRNYNTLN